MEIRCKECKNMFEAHHPLQKYCGNKCRNLAWKNYQKEYTKRQRIKKKAESIARFIDFFEGCKNEYKSDGKWTHEMSMRMMKLVAKQENNPPRQKKDYCEVCYVKEKLIEHHVKYSPIVVKVTLCTSCHAFLHKSLIRRKIKL